AGALGPVAALTAGGLVPLVASGLSGAFGTTVRAYRVPEEAAGSAV
ncbi:MFS transporter, partial [Streptomyces sp. SID8380]|nr:MFS transporter [Streptomyces sp. SID8380]